MCVGGEGLMGVCLSLFAPLKEPNFRFILLQPRTHFQPWMSMVPKGMMQYDENNIKCYLELFLTSLEGIVYVPIE